ncbi:MAG: phage baseplate protein [Pseudomonadota bacterium]|nr:phage baseplate protein [Pseudomonadota bacterium]
MIGIDRKTGRTLTGFQEFVARVEQVMTTPLGAREKRPDFGSRVPETLARNMGDDLLMLVQAHALEAFYNTANGLTDFTPDQVVATRGANGVLLRISGQWRYGAETFEVPL